MGNCTSANENKPKQQSKPATQKKPQAQVQVNTQVNTQNVVEQAKEAVKKVEIGSDLTEKFKEAMELNKQGKNQEDSGLAIQAKESYEKGLALLNDIQGKSEIQGTDFLTKVKALIAELTSNFTNCKAKVDANPAAEQNVEINVEPDREAINPDQIEGNNDEDDQNRFQDMNADQLKDLDNQN